MGIFILVASSFVSLILLAAAVLFTLYRKEIVVENRIAVFLGVNFEKNHEPEKETSETEKFSLKARLAGTLLTKIKAIVMKRMSSHSAKSLELRLQEAGRPFNWTPVDFRAIQILLAILIFSVTLLLALPGAENPFKIFMIGLGGAALGIWYPNAMIRTRKQKRKKEIEKLMPDFFDMTNLAIEAGMGLDAAILKVCKQMDGPLSEEFLVTLEDMKLGKSRKDALTSLKKRVASDDFQSIITQLIQADYLGIGMAKVIKSLTQRIRETQRESVREKAMKVPVKMLLPIVFFIFPSLFIVILGPVVLSFLKSGL